MVTETMNKWTLTLCTNALQKNSTQLYWSMTLLGMGEGGSGSKCMSERGGGDDCAK